MVAARERHARGAAIAAVAAEQVAERVIVGRRRRSRVS